MGELPLLFGDVARWYAATTVALGLRTGLTQALLGGGGTAAELATASATDPANAARWADAMVTAGYARLADGRYDPEWDALGALQGGAVLDVRAIVELLVPLGGMLPRVEAAIRDGGGIPSAEIQAALGALPEEVNAPMYRQLLVEEWIAGHPELEAALRDGIDVAEIGPGGGEALRLLAAAFPSSRFTGVDLDPLQVRRANDVAAALGLPNVAYVARDGANLPATSFDLVCILDAFHHVTRPAALIEAVRAALRPGGSLLVAEAAVTGDASVDAADPTAVIVYGSDLLYCFQESKTAATTGLGATWAGRDMARFLGEHGFREAARVESQAGYLVVRAVLDVTG